MALQLNGSQVQFTSPNLGEAAKGAIERQKALKDMLLERAMREAFQKSIDPTTGDANPEKYRQHLASTGFNFNPQEQAMINDYLLQNKERQVKGGILQRQGEAVGLNPQTMNPAREPEVPVIQPQAKVESPVSKSRPIPLDERRNMELGYTKTKKADAKTTSIQSELKNIGFLGEADVDGKFGSKTQSAIDAAKKSGYSFVQKEDGSYGFEKPQAEDKKSLTVPNPTSSQDKPAKEDLMVKSWREQKPVEVKSGDDELKIDYSPYLSSNKTSKDVLSMRKAALETMYGPLNDMASINAAEKRFIDAQVINQIGARPVPPAVVSDPDKFMANDAEYKQKLADWDFKKKKALAGIDMDALYKTAFDRATTRTKLGYEAENLAISKDKLTAEQAERYVVFPDGKTALLPSKQQAELFYKFNTSINTLRETINLGNRENSLARLGPVLDADLANILGTNPTEGFSKGAANLFPVIPAHYFLNVKDRYDVKDAIIRWATSIDEKESTKLLNDLADEMEKGRMEAFWKQRDQSIYNVGQRRPKDIKPKEEAKPSAPTASSVAIPAGKKEGDPFPANGKWYKVTGGKAVEIKKGGK